MQIRDALSILNLHQHPITLDDIKMAYRRAAAKYHPDHNPAGLEMMKLVNIAYDTLKDYEGDIESPESSNDYGQALNAALNAIVGLGLDIEICGAWIWVSGDTRLHKEILKAAGYLWAPIKKRWYFRPEAYKSRNRQSWSMDKIRDAYGSQGMKEESRREIIA